MSNERRWSLSAKRPFRTKTVLRVLAMQALLFVCAASIQFWSATWIGGEPADFGTVMGSLTLEGPEFDGCDRCKVVAASHTGLLHLVSAGWTGLIALAVVVSRRTRPGDPPEDSHGD